MGKPRVADIAHRDLPAKAPANRPRGRRSVMSIYLLSNVKDEVLEQELARFDSNECGAMAMVLARIAEIDARRLYLRAAYPSMRAYCVQKLNKTEDWAHKRITAARAALRFPEIFEFVADGRLHLSGVCQLAPHLTAGNVVELLRASTRKTKAEIEQVLAARFPRTEMMELVQVIPAAGGAHQQPATAHIEVQGGGQCCIHSSVPATTSANVPPATITTGAAIQGAQAQSAAAHPQGVSAALPAERVVPTSKVAPIAQDRYALQITVGQDTYDLLREARELLGHQVPNGNLAQVFHLALESLVGTLEKRKFAATTRPQAAPRPSTAPRTIPAHVRRAVWARDRGQCTFTSDTGRRCTERTRLEFDHVLEVARGGTASGEGIRLRCRVHNQYTAECTFGVDFMARKREEARAS